MIIVPNENDIYVAILLDKMKVEYSPEIVPIIAENDAKIHNCFINVINKVNDYGGKIHYGWAIYKSNIICEAERHAVWETTEGDLIDITPSELDIKEILFVSDNNDFEYAGQLIDNIRINITKNSSVDDFIYLCENIEKLYSIGTRIDDGHVAIPIPVKEVIDEYTLIKNYLIDFLHDKGSPMTICFCGSKKYYKNCHGIVFRTSIADTVSKLQIAYQDDTDL